MTADIIAARRQHIQDSAPCEGCGATLADCMANRGKDPTAPAWFGCCARGIEFMTPCQHTPSASALLELLAEIESGTVRTVEEATPKPRERGMSWLDYLDQGEKWKPKGRPMVAIADMDPEWRYNASRLLERRAAVIREIYRLELSEEFRAEIPALRDDPVGWIRGTALYRALVADLPNCSIALTAIAERAKHWSTCPAHTESGDCRCEELRAQHEANTDPSPEWTDD